MLREEHEVLFEDKDNIMDSNILNALISKGSVIINNILPYLSQGLGWVAIMLAPIKVTMIAVSCMVILDLITGIWASIKRKEILTSNGFRRTVTKTLAYQLVLISSMIMEQHFLQGLPVVQIIAGLIAVTEFKSLLENATSILGIDFWTAIVEKLHGQKIIPIPKEIQQISQTVEEQVVQPSPEPEPILKKKSSRKKTKSRK